MEIDPETKMWEGILKQYTDKIKELEAEIKTLKKVNRGLKAEIKAELELKLELKEWRSKLCKRIKANIKKLRMARMP